MTRNKFWRIGIVLALLASTAFTAQVSTTAAGAQAPEVAISHTCYDVGGRTDGRLTIALNNTTGAFAEYRIEIGTQGLIRTAQVGAGVPITINVTGRPDGALETVVLRNGSEIARQTELIDCDVSTGPEVEISDSCLAGAGRVDLAIDNAGAAATYTLTVGTVVKTATIDPGSVGRLTVTGRPDATYAVTADRDGTQLLSETVVVTCEPDSISITSQCMAGNGRVNLYVPGPDSALTYAVGAVGPRPYQQTDSGNRGVVTARPDGTHTVVLFSAGGSIAATGTVTIDCDNDGPGGVAICSTPGQIPAVTGDASSCVCRPGHVANAAGDCVTRGISCAYGQIELTSFPGVIGGSVTETCIPESDCPWSAIGVNDRTGLVTCLVALP